MDPSNGATNGGQSNNNNNSSSSNTDDLFNFGQAAASMFMNGTSTTTGGMDEMWGMSGDNSNMFFNMDAFSSAPVSAVGTTGTSAAAAAAALPPPALSSSSGIDLSAAFGLDMNGASMDPDAWKMLLQGDPSMDDLFAGFGSSSSATAPLPLTSPPPPPPPGISSSSLVADRHHPHPTTLTMATLAPSDLEAFSRPPPSHFGLALPQTTANTMISPPQMSLTTAPASTSSQQLKSPTPSAKKPRAPKAKKAVSGTGGTLVPVGNKATKAKAKKAATPKLKSPTPLPTDVYSVVSPVATGESPDTARRLKSKTDGASAASPTPSAKSVVGTQSFTPATTAPFSAQYAAPPSLATGMFQSPQQQQLYQQQNAYLLQQQQQHGAYLQQQNAALASIMNMAPSMRMSVLQQLQATSASMPGNQALLQAYQQIQQQQQQQQQQQLGVNISSGIQGSPYMSNAQPGAMAQQGMMMGGGARMPQATTQQLQQLQQISQGSVANNQSQSHTPNMASSALQPVDNNNPSVSSSSAQFPPQQRMFMGTNIPMPHDIAAEIDRQLNLFRAQFGSSGSAADLATLQQSIEQQMLGRYINSQQQNRATMPGHSGPPDALGSGMQQQQQQQQPQVLQPAMRPAANPPVVPATGNVSVVGGPPGSSVGMSANFTQHMALVSMLSKNHVQVLLNQLRAQLPQLFGTLSLDNFTQLLVSGQLANNQTVNQVLVLLAQGIQNQIQQQRFQQQQMVGSSPGVNGPPPPSSRPPPPPPPPLMSGSGGGGGLQQGMSPQMQMQLQLQNYQRMQMYQQQQQQQQQMMASAGIRPPPGQIMSPPPPPQSQTPVGGGLQTAGRIGGGTPTPGTAGQQRGLKRKSVNNSPAQAPGVPPPSVGQNKSPMGVPATTSVDNGETKLAADAAVVVGPEEDGAATTTTTSGSSAATTASVPAPELSASGMAAQALLSELASPPPPPLPPQQSAMISPQHQQVLVSSSSAVGSSAMMAGINQMAPVQRQMFATQQPLQYQHMQQVQQQQSLLQAQMGLMQILPNFQQLPGQVQVNLVHLFAQQRQLQYTYQQYQATVQSPSITQQQRAVILTQLPQLQSNLAIINHQLTQQLSLAKAMAATGGGSGGPPLPLQQQAVVVAPQPPPPPPPQPPSTEPPPPPPPPSLAVAGDFFRKDINSGTTTTTTGGGEAATAAPPPAVAASGPEKPVSGVTTSSALAPPAPAPDPLLAEASPSHPAAAAAAAAAAANPSSSSSNFYLAPSQPPPLPPTVLAADKVTEVLDATQQQELAAWQRAADATTRANAFRARETGVYQKREDQYRRSLDAQRQQNGAMVAAMRRDREAEKQWLGQPLAWGRGYNGYGNGSTATNGLTLVMPAQRKAPVPGQLATLRFSQRQLRRQAELRQVLVPIRLDIDMDGHRLRDTFTWDLNNELIPPLRFALGMCADMGLPPDSFAPLIVQSIEEQVDDFRLYGHVEALSTESVKQSLVAAMGKDDSDDDDDNDDSLVWVDDELRVVIRIDIIIGHIALRDQLEWDVAPLLRPPPPPPSVVDALPHSSDSSDEESPDEDGHVPQLDCSSPKRLARWQVAAIRDWASGALEGQSVTPEHVARVVCSERGLGGEFETAYAHSLREQLYAFAKSFLLAGYAHRPQMLGKKKKRRRPVLVDDRELAKSVLAPIMPGSAIRKASSTMAPLIAHLHSVDVERLERDADRDARRKRRAPTAAGGGRLVGSSSSGGGGGGGGGSGGSGRGGVRADQSRGSNLAVPDREAHRTNRTMIALPAWFADELPPGTRSFVDVPGEGAHFLDAYDTRAAHEAMSLAPPLAPPHITAVASEAGITPNPDSLSADHHDEPGGSSSSHHYHPPAAPTGRRMNSSSASADPAPLLTPVQAIRDKLRNPTGRPRGRPSFLEKALRDAAARRSGPSAGAAPVQLSGRPLEELLARWRCMSCGLPPDRTPLIRRGPESMHSLCDECGDIYTKTHRFRDISLAEITHNTSLVCGPLVDRRASAAATAAAAARPPPPPPPVVDPTSELVESPLTSLSATSIVDEI